MNYRKILNRRVKFASSNQEAEQFLAGYSSTDSKADWVPNYLLYLKYQIWYTSKHHWFGTFSNINSEHRSLRRREFGYVVAKHFPAAKPCNRLLEGKQARGWMYLKGPDSMKSVHKM